MTKKQVKHVCPVCSNRKIQEGYNDLASNFEEVASEWDYEKNYPLKPTQVTFGSNKRVYWKCEKGHSWRSAVYKRTLNKHNCPICCNQIIVAGINDLASHPKYGYLAKEWHPTLNGDLTPEKVPFGSNRKVYWKCDKGHVWKASISHRTTRGQGCKLCTGSAMEKLAYDILKRFNMDFNREFSFKESKEVGKYRYDIYMEKFKMLVELDGEQHLKDGTGVFNQKTSLEERIRRDNLKNTYALDNQIPILRIP